MRTIHLSVVKLEGELERLPWPAILVPAPNQERVIEDATIHPDSPINITLH
jgi:hypothetical protein